MSTVHGYILLEGGAEFGGRMADVDLRAMELAGGVSAQIDIIPAAAAPDKNHLRAGANGVSWFKRLGATKVISQPLIDYQSAHDRQLASKLESSSLLYLLGGFPRHLANSLKHTRCWQSMLVAWQKGAVLGGSSAGAMVLAQHFYDPRQDQVVVGLGLLPNLCIIPHFAKFSKSWSGRLKSLLPDATILGIDEETGIINDVEDKSWTVYGKGNVYLIGQGISEFSPGETISTSLLKSLDSIDQSTELKNIRREND